jgi:porin
MQGCSHGLSSIRSIRLLNGRGRFRMPRMIVCRRAVIALLLWLATNLSHATAQDPEIIPGMPGESLPAGELPNLNSPILTRRGPDSDVASQDFDAVSADETAAPPDFGITGDWLGRRTALFDRGITFRTNVTQFYQGVVAGGLDQGFGYGLKLDYFSVLEGEKLLGWKGLYLNLHGETRTGQSINGQGSLLPANFALFFPQPTGTNTALTNFQFAQFLTDDIVATFGKINTPDGVNIHPFLGG